MEKSIEQEIARAVAELRQSGEDFKDLPSGYLTVLRVGGKLFQEIEADEQGFFIPIQDEVEFVITF